jgi:(p)ppGpp synthase/HD superfamily hydrolase
MEDVLQKIRDFADEAHGDQKRKYANERYIEHPVRVMELCRIHTQSLPILSAALLHDVLEDTAIREYELKRFLLSLITTNDVLETIKLVKELTDVYTRDNYPRLNRTKRKAREAERLSSISADAQTIKYADIIDNCKNLSSHDAEFAPVFLNECLNLVEKMQRGNQTLRSTALLVIKHEIELSRMAIRREK